MTCHSIDLRVPEAGSVQERTLVERLFADVLTSSSDLLVAYRGSQRWAQTFEPVRVPESAQPSIRLRKKGVYVIPGGLSGIGVVLAEHLARTFKARLVLTTFTEFPPREAWESWENTHSENDSVSLRIRKMKGLEAHGAEILIVTADVTSEEQMENVISRTEDSFGLLNGVIYAANNLGKAALGSIEETDTAKCRQQLHSTMRGAAVLANVLSGRELDWCLLTSSLSSVLGGLGLVAYSAASNFLDAFACRQALMSDVPWLSINWDHWKLDDTSEGTSMRNTHLDQSSITPVEGVDVFERILSCDGAGQMVVSTVDLHSRLDQWIVRKSQGEADSAGRHTQCTAHARPDLVTPYAAPRNDIEQALVEIWQPLIGLEKVGIHDDFFELGGDSLLAVQIITRVRETFGLDLPLTNLFERATVAALAEYIEISRWGEQTPFAETDQEGREEIEI